jgi:predicted transcriptional regulator of viral defense system
LRDVGILQIFYSQAVTQRTIVDSSAFLDYGLVEKIAVCVHTTRDPHKQEVGLFLYKAAQNFEVFSNIQNKV